MVLALLVLFPLLLYFFINVFFCFAMYCFPSCPHCPHRCFFHEPFACSQQGLDGFSPQAEPSTSKEEVFLLACRLLYLHTSPSECICLTNASYASEAEACWP